MTRRGIVTLLIAAAVLLVGAVASAPRTAKASPDQQYLQTVRVLLNGTSGGSQTDAQLVADGRSICSDVAHGASASTFTAQIHQYGMDYGLERALIRAAVLAYCPKATYAIPR